MIAIGSVNKNNQHLNSATGGRRSPRHRFAYVYELRCGERGHPYESQGCDVHERRCPSPRWYCPVGGGRP